MKRLLPVLLSAAVAASLLAAPGAMAEPVGGETASTSGWKQRCDKKRTKQKRRACKKRHKKHKQSSAPTVTAPAPAPAAAADAVYSGTMITTIDYYDVCSHYLGREQTQLNVRVIVGAPLGPTAQSPDLLPAVGAETNPVRLVVGEPTAAEQIAPGSIALASAQRFNSTSPNVNLQYWNLALNGSALTGTLVEDHREEAAAYNLLAAHQQLVPCQAQFGYYPNQFPIAEGSTLTGTLTPASIQLQIAGNVLEGTRPFLAQISANRAG